MSGAGGRARRSDPLHTRNRRSVRFVAADEPVLRRGGVRCLNPRVITLDSLTKVFPAPGGGDPVVALDGIDLHLEPGRVHGIVGRSGAGKSTLIRCLTGLEKPTRSEERRVGKERGTRGTMKE